MYQPIVALPDETHRGGGAGSLDCAQWSADPARDVRRGGRIGRPGGGAGWHGSAAGLHKEVARTGLDVDIHVNIGAARMGHPGFEDQVRRTLSQCEIEPGRLVVEITETLPIVDLADAAAQIDRLNAMGARVALDDFGAGYNSLAYLHALPIDIVKLDRSLAVGSEAVRELTLYRSVVGHAPIWASTSSPRASSPPTRRRRCWRRAVGSPEGTSSVGRLRCPTSSPSTARSVATPETCGPACGLKIGWIVLDGPVV